MIGDRQLARLVKFFTEAPSSKYKPEDISITFGEARIKYDSAAGDFDATGHVDRGVYGKLMLDAATLAAGTLVEDRFVVNEAFDMYAMQSIQEGKLIAVARLVHAQQNRFTVEVRLLDKEGRAIASGHGTFSISKFSMDGKEGGEGEEASKEEDDVPVAYGSIWRTPYGYIHQN